MKPAARPQRYTETETALPRSRESGWRGSRLGHAVSQQVQMTAEALLEMGVNFAEQADVLAGDAAAAGQHAVAQAEIPIQIGQRRSDFRESAIQRFAVQV